MMSYVSLLREFYVSLLQVQEHLLNQSSYVSSICPVSNIKSRRIGPISHILYDQDKVENRAFTPFEGVKRLFDC